MLTSKIFVTVLILAIFLTACQADPTAVQPESPGADPYPPAIYVPIIQEPAYPAPGDVPVEQDPVNPYPASGQGPMGSYTDPVYAPQTGDADLTVGNALPDLQASDLLVLESYPVQINLVLRGDLPTPCNQLRIKVTPPDDQNRIQVQVYSVVDPNQLCTQVLEPYEALVSLGSFAGGKYSIYVNGEYLGEFEN
jgi:hypothetical protein